MNIRWILLGMIVPALVGCGSENGQGTASEVETQPVASASSGEGDSDGFNWRVEYTGDLEGEVGGSIMSVGGFASNTTIAGGAMNDDRTGAADHNFGATIMRYGDEPITTVDLTLADGTRCFDVTSQDSESSAVNVIDPEHDTFRAEIEGTLYCGTEKDQRIDFKAYLDADR